MKKVILNMNELKKYKVIKLISEGRKSKKRAAVELNLTIRNINRLLNAYRKEGKEAFSHGNRNKSVKHAVPQEIKQKIINFYQALPVPMNFVHFRNIWRSSIKSCILIQLFVKFFIVLAFYHQNLIVKHVEK